jgi:hypothetical protein
VENEVEDSNQWSERQSLVYKVLVQLIINAVVMLSFAVYFANQWQNNAQTLVATKNQYAAVDQIRKNETLLHQYIYSGVPSDAAEFESGRRALLEIFQGNNRSKDDMDAQKLSAAENDWYMKFAKPVMEKRFDMDHSRNNITLSQMQVYYLTLRAEGPQEKLHSAMDRYLTSASRDLTTPATDLTNGLDFAKYALLILGVMNLVAFAGLWLARKTV